MPRVKGIVWHKGMKVPVEVEVTTNWLGLPGVVVHMPKSYSGTNDLPHMIDFTADLEEDATEVTEEDRQLYGKGVK